MARAPAAATAPPAAPQLALESDSGSRKALKPWIEVALPHPDVIANRFKEAEFAADLFAVDAGHAGEGYATPANFFGITFLTEGLKRVLTTARAAARRRRRRSGDRPANRVRRRQDAHDARDLPSVKHLARAAIRAACRASANPRHGPAWRSLPKPKIAVFVGSSKGTDVSLNLKDGPRVKRSGAIIAWRLAGRCRTEPRCRSRSRAHQSRLRD